MKKLFPVLVFVFFTGLMLIFPGYTNAQRCYATSNTCPPDETDSKSDLIHRYECSDLSNPYPDQPDQQYVAICCDSVATADTLNLYDCTREEIGPEVIREQENQSYPEVFDPRNTAEEQERIRQLEEQGRSGRSGGPITGPSQSLGTIGTGGGLGPFSNITGLITAGVALETLISVILGLITTIAGIWFLFQFLIGAFNWVSSGGDPKKLESAQHRITNAIVGLIIVVATWIVVGVVGVVVGLKILNPADIIINNLRIGDGGNIQGGVETTETN